jgi:hypothetical protein
VVRLSFATARLEAGPLGARWEGGAELPLLPVPDRRDLDDPAQPRPAAPAGAPVGLLGSAVWLRHPGHDRAPGGDVWPWPADLGDLQAIGRVLAALRESARLEAPATVA